ncbi:glycine zipper domain-containing protein [Serratia marcescens]|uniref:glycine zipper domain-containing protein n=1 Tax=Serratia marcescens TaxID=615 RepID=UPI003FA7BDFA
MFGKAEDKANEAAGAVEETFGKAVDSPEHQVRGAARKYASQASYAARDAADSVRTQVEANPLAGVAVAAAVGIVFGFLLGRK